MSPDVLAIATAEGEADFIIEMVAQADLSPATLVRGKTAKNRYVVEALRAQAQNTQPPVLAKLNELGVVHQAFWIANAISGRGTASELQAIASMPEVDYIHGVAGVRHIGSFAGTPAKADEVRDAPVEPGLALVRAPQVWELGFTGQGVVVGDHDIGVLWDHAALKKQYRGWDGETASHDYNWLNAFPEDPFCDDLATPCDPHGHGTHTTGTMVGDDGGDNRIGMAPGVSVRSSSDNGDYTKLSGTSMAGPHVAGLVALMLSAAPDLKGEVDTVREIIEQTAVPITTGETCGGTTDADLPNNTFGYGRIDALAAVEAAIAATQAPKQKAEGRGLLAGAFDGLALLSLLGLSMLRRRRAV